MLFAFATILVHYRAAISHLAGAFFDCRAITPAFGWHDCWLPLHNIFISLAYLII
jgi:hypothetical protein